MKQSNLTFLWNFCLWMLVKSELRSCPREASIMHVCLNKPNTWLPSPLYALQKNNEKKSNINKTIHVRFWSDPLPSQLTCVRTLWMPQRVNAHIHYRLFIHRNGVLSKYQNSWRLTHAKISTVKVFQNVFYFSVTGYV